MDPRGLVTLAHFLKARVDVVQFGLNGFDGFVVWISCNSIVNQLAQSPELRLWAFRGTNDLDSFGHAPPLEGRVVIDGLPNAVPQRGKRLVRHQAVARHLNLQELAGVLSPTFG